MRAGMLQAPNEGAPPRVHRGGECGDNPAVQSVSVDFPGPYRG